MELQYKRATFGRYPDIACPASKHQNSDSYQQGAMIEITLLDMILCTGTRVALGIGIGMLIQGDERSLQSHPKN